MTAVRQWVALGVAAVLAVLAAGWFLLVQPQRAEAAALRDSTAEQLRSNAQLQTQLDVLEAQARDLPQELAELAAVATRIPADTAEPALLRALAAAAATVGVELVSVTPGALTPVAAAGASAATPAPPTASADGTATAVPAAPPAGSAGTLMSLPLTLQVAGGFDQVEAYLAALEELPRAFRVTGLAVVPRQDPAAAGATAVPDGSSLVADITGTVFVATGAAPAVPPVVPAGAQEETS